MRTKIVTRNVEAVLAAFALLAGCAEDPRIAKEAAEPAPVSVEKEPCRGNDCVSHPAESAEDDANGENDGRAPRDEDAATSESDDDSAGAASEDAEGTAGEDAEGAAGEDAEGAAGEDAEGAAGEGAEGAADEDAESATDDGAEGAPGDDVEPTDEAGADVAAPKPTSDPAPDADSHTNSDAPAMTSGEGDSSGDPVVPVTDACDPNPCQHGGTCSDASGTASCLCPDGFEGPHCEIRFCGSATIRSRADLDALRECSEIRGDLRIASVGLAAIEADDLPLLTKITGHLAISGTHVSDQPLLQSVTLKNLRTIEGTLMVLGLAVPEFGGSGPLRELHLPALESVGVHDALGLAVVQASLATLDLPALKTIEGAILLDTAFELCTVNVSNVESVDGALTVRYVPNLSPAQLEPLRAGAAGPVSEQLLGCCEASPEDGAACEAFTENARALYCGGCG